MADFTKIPEKTLYIACDDKRVKVFVGGVNTEYFAPSVNMSFKLESPSEKYFLNICDDLDQVKTESKSEIFDGGESITVKDGQVESCFKSTDGGIKIERVFYIKPTAAPRYKLEFSKGVKFHYQPELTQEEIADGHIRPDNVVGSYAIYCDKAGHYKDKSGKTTVNYGSGKIGHLYAPYWTDSGGKKTKVTQEIVGNTLIFALPNEKWLDEAVYPITLDPDVDLGHTGTGASVEAVYSTKLYALYLGLAASAGTPTSLSAIMNYFDKTAPDIGMIAVYAAGSPVGDLVAQTEIVASTDVGVSTKKTYTFDVTGTPDDLVADAAYYAGLYFARTGNYGNTGLVCYVAYDANVDYDNYSKIRTFDETFPDPFPSTPGNIADKRYSVWVTYTEAGGSTLLPINRIFNGPFYGPFTGAL